MSTLPSVLEDTWNAAEPKLKQIQAALLSDGKFHYPRITRVTQLDAELLDQELVQILLDPILGALSLIHSTLKVRVEPELGLLIRFMLYRLSIWNTGASYGAKLQNLKYVVQSAQSKKLTPSGLPRHTLFAHASLTLILPYLHDRLRAHALSHAWPDAPSSDSRRKTWNVLSAAENIHALLGLGNFIIFLWGGRYRTLSDRMLKMSLVPSRSSLRRDVSYEFMNRQMVWHAFTEFLLFVLPLINRRTLRYLAYQTNSFILGSSSFSLLRNIIKLHPTPRKHEKDPHQQSKYSNLPDDQCAICIENAGSTMSALDPGQVIRTFTSSSQSDPVEPSSQPIYNPYQTTCGHVYCYQCIAGRMMQAVDEPKRSVGWECLRCGEFVKEAHRYRVGGFDSHVSESEYEFSSDIDLSTDLSGSMYSFSESGRSE